MTFFRSLATVSTAVLIVALARAGYEIIPTQQTIDMALTSAGVSVGAVLIDAMRAYARKVGGLTFLRLGRLSLSFCITKN